MTSDDQHFLDTLAGISSDIRKLTGDIASQTEAHIDSLAASIRKTLSDSSWIPNAARPPAPPPPPPKALGLLARTQSWVSKHRAITAAVVAFISTGAIVYSYQRSARRRHRRAVRAPNGARKEVVVVAGPISSPYTKSIALDLERRGFIVYVVVHSVEEEQEVHNESRTDIRPLNLELVEPLTSAHAIERFNVLLSNAHHAFAGAEPHHLEFTGLVIVPDLIYSLGPIQAVDAELWSDAINSKILGTVAVTQAFLPTVIKHGARVLVLTPSVVSSLQPAFNGVESTVIGALEGFTSTLQREMATLSIQVTHLKLGAFDCGKVGDRHHLAPLGKLDSLQWPSALQRLYSDNYITASRRGMRLGLFSETGSSARGSSLRELNHAVFDSLAQRRTGKVIRVGRRSREAELVGKIAPASLVSWMLGLRRVTMNHAHEPVVSLEDSTAAWEKVDEEKFS